MSKDFFQYLLLKYSFYFYLKRLLNLIIFLSPWSSIFIEITFYCYFKVKVKKYSNPYYTHEIILLLILLIIIFYFRVSLIYLSCIIFYFFLLLYLYLNNYYDNLFYILQVLILLPLTCFFLIYILETYYKFRDVFEKFQNTNWSLKNKRNSPTESLFRYFKRVKFTEMRSTVKNINLDKNTYKNNILKKFWDINKPFEEKRWKMYKPRDNGKWCNGKWWDIANSKKKWFKIKKYK